MGTVVVVVVVAAFVSWAPADAGTRTAVAVTMESRATIKGTGRIRPIIFDIWGKGAPG